MATKRQRSSGNWEYVVKRKNLLVTPLYLTFDSEREGDAYVARLEALLDKGIVPDEFKAQAESLVTIADAIRDYLASQAVPASDRKWLAISVRRLGEERLRSVSYEWAEQWVTRMKREQHLSPTTIRHHVGALARCFDWAERKGVSAVIPNPLRKLPTRYATYSEADEAYVRAIGKDIKVENERDRRLGADEEARIRCVLSGEVPTGRQRALRLKWQGALECLFDLALETAMRMREMYTLRPDQLDFERKTVFLERTKNGDKRQVPLTSVASKVLKQYLRAVKQGQRGMQEFTLDNGLLFPWWDGKESSFETTTVLLSRQFSRIFEAAECIDLRFHDLRHEATSRFFERTRLSDIQISRITGHKEPRVLRRYANLRGSDLAAHLW